MDYEDIVSEIEKQSITKLPALLIVIVELCIKKNVFVKGGTAKVIKRIINENKGIKI